MKKNTPTTNRGSESILNKYNCSILNKELINSAGVASLPEHILGEKNIEENTQQGDTLPKPPRLLTELSGTLGELQNYIYNAMSYPCRYTAGWTAIATFSGFAQTHLTIDSRRGLGFNEYFLTLAPTGFGKEDLRKPFGDILKVLKEDRSIMPQRFPHLEHAAPSSKQGLHQLLENSKNITSNSVYIQSDEFAEWLKKANTDQNKAQALAYLLEIYTKALGTIHPGRAITNEYQNIKNPRLGIFATTTAESLLSTLSADNAEMGAYNRWIIFVASKNNPCKRYKGLCYEIPTSVIEGISWLLKLDELCLKINNKAYDAFIANDKDYAEPIKQNDNLLGGRLSEQAIKLAGLFALSDKRLEISDQDINRAYLIRLSLYTRAKAMIDEHGAISGKHITVEAYEQLERAFKKAPQIYISQFSKRSRAYKQLSLSEQLAVRRHLTNNGIAKQSDNKKIYLSLVYTQED